MAGTSDAVKIIKNLSQYSEIEIIATTTTKYGGELAVDAGADETIIGHLGFHEISDLLDLNKIEVLIDATHPFAAEATLNAVRSANKSNIKYIRFERPPTPIPNSELVFQVNSFEEASKMAMEITEQDKRIMHLAGVSTLPHMLRWNSPKKIIARVLPVTNSIKKCLELEIPVKNIIAMQGTFSKEFNTSLLREFKIGLQVTKESGETGGTKSKLDAAIGLKIPTIIVKRPVIIELKNETVYTNIQDLTKKIVELF